MSLTEGHAKALLENPKDALAEPAVCLDCRWHGRVGALMARDTLRCPECDSANWHPAGGEVVSLSEYHGAVGTKN